MIKPIGKLFVALLWLALSAGVQAQLAFTTNNGAITITGYNTAAGPNVIIPAATNGYPVTSIGDGAFYECMILTNVIIPNNVTSIGDNAFYYCSSLTNVTIGNSVTTIGTNAFENCSLRNVIVPDSVTNLEEAAFESCISLTNVSLGSGVKSIGDDAFYFCYSLTNVIIPNGVTNVGGGAFYFCPLTSVIIPGSVRSIGDYSFGFCKSLTKVTLSGGIMSIGQYAFVDCPLTGVVIPNSVANVGDNAFYNCDQLAEATIGDSVTNLGDFVFGDCPGLTNITVDAANPAYSSLGGILFDKAQATLLQFPGGLGGGYTMPDSVTNIGQYAFVDCPVTSVAIPNSVISIGDDAFENCDSLTNVSIGSGVTSIGESAFFGCRFTSVVIPNSVTNIGQSAFDGIPFLTTAYFQGNAPGESAFGFDYPAAVYYLPGRIGWGSTYDNLAAILWNPQANTPGFTGGHFGFNLTGPDNVTIVVEACANLSNPVWLPVATKTFSDSGASTFIDPSSGGNPSRYYRFRSP